MSDHAKSTEERVARMATSIKRVRIDCASSGGDKDAPTSSAPLHLQVRFKDAYIIQSGRCDYTGLRVWPGAEMLAAAMHRAGQAGLLSSLHVCELGAGVGLSGLVAACYASHAWITDRVPLLLQLLRSNARLNGLDSRTTVVGLDWGIEGARALVESEARAVSEEELEGEDDDLFADSASKPVVCPTVTPTPVPASCCSCHPLPPPSSPSAPLRWDSSRSLVVAADVIYPDISEGAMSALFDTVHVLLGAHATPFADDDGQSHLPCSCALRGSFVVSYVPRSSDTSRRFLLAASRTGWEGRVFSLRSKEEEETQQSAPDGGVVLQFRRCKTATAPAVDSLPTSDAPPAWVTRSRTLSSLWSPPPSLQALALAELERAEEGSDGALFAGMALDSSDESGVE